MGDSNAPKVPAEFPSFTKITHSEPYDTINVQRPALSAAGKNIVITGGGTGIGKHIALAFARAGASSVSILGRREDRLISASKEITDAATEAYRKNTKILYRVTDITKKDNVDESLKSIVDEVGPLHVLVSNAGVFPGVGPLADPTSTEVLMSGFEINVRGALNAVQTFMPLSSPAPDGSDATILNIGTGTHMAPLAGIGAYITSKAANHKMMDHIAAENSTFHVVGIQPGTILTEMSEPAKAMIQRWDSPDLPGHFCVWLVSKEARFLKSKFVWAAWDVDEMMQRQDEIKNSRLLTWLLDGLPA